MTTSAPRGRLAGRVLRSIVAGRGDVAAAVAFASAQKWDNNELVAKAIVGSLTSDGVPHIAQAVAQDLLGLVPPFSVVARLQGFRRVPPRTSLVTQTNGAVGYWGDSYASGGAAIPASRGGFSRFAGIAERRVSALSVVTQELALSGTPGTDETIATDLARALGIAVDSAFLNPLSSGSPATSPASVTSSGRIFTATPGASPTVDQVDADLEALIRALHDGGSDLTNATWCVNTLTATRLSRVRGTGGAPAYPGITAKGGVLLGLPCLTSPNIARAGSPSPGLSYLSLIDASRIWMTDRDEVAFSASTQALIEMLDNPVADASAGTPAQGVSMFQTSSVALKSTRYLNWQPAEGQGHAATLVNCEW